MSKLLAMRGILVASALSTVVALSAFAAAGAGPAVVGLYAGGCYGQGGTSLVAGGGAIGYTYDTSGCGSERYLQSSHAYSGGSFNYNFGWQPYQLYAQTLAGNGITAAASTHNLRYIFSSNGYVGTNTW